MKRWLLIMLLGVPIFSWASNVYSPIAGVICDKIALYCVDEQGISMGLTAEYLGPKAQEALVKKVDSRVSVHLWEYTLSNGVYCDSHEKQCYLDRYYPRTKEKYAPNLTQQIFGQQVAANNTLDITCRANQLEAHLDNKNGEFDGMSQRGTLLELRNTSKTACQVPALPTLIFKTKENKNLNVERHIPKGMHPGPVLLPITLKSNEKATMKIHWVSGDVYDEHHCVTPNNVTLILKDDTLKLPFGYQLCASSESTQFYDQTSFSVVNSTLK